MALKYSPYIQTIADAAYLNGSASYVSSDISAGGLFYDVLSWDPRSVNNTTPFHACFSDPLELAHYSDVTHPLPGSPEFNLNEEWARHMALAQGCLADEALNPKGGSIADFMTTETVVRDMVEILERTGEWREAEVKKEIVEQNLISKMSETEVDNLLDARKWKKGEEKISYWGMSSFLIVVSNYILTPQAFHMAPSWVPPLPLFSHIVLIVSSLMVLQTQSTITMAVGLPICRTLTRSWTTSSHTALRQVLKIAAWQSRVTSPLKTLPLASML
jgi:hypothetical protein